ncbi:iron-sulfur cluster co-chaperone protein HscB isoform X2 [Daktulosphaira vitifoliae]|uniref:iron-sulfur cluster co-chaperone protein HscB isoform X2 n=1 Tax=Daktulosphaira vitifoliae TaxID=58002 RepID=UPI0021AA4D99|nr:iron-sulfur cluster co-chaperone protein HscB isoform X2 [Daktulosphaira vitifoliae]
MYTLKTDLTLKRLCISKSSNLFGFYNTYVRDFHFKCWKCQHIAKEKPSLFCHNCTVIQSSEEQNFNYFELFNLELNYSIDIGILTTNFRKLQSLIHPDKFSNKTKEEKKMSENFSSILNKAYGTLINPLQRGLYMLSLHGLNIEENPVTFEKSFLINIMEWNEQIEEANSKLSLEKLQIDVRDILDNTYKELSIAFINKDFNQAKILLSRAKYFVSMLNTIKEKEL